MRHAASPFITFILLLSSVVAGAAELDPKWLRALEYRFIGPTRGGRSTSVHGVLGDPVTYYMGTSGGGVWKTVDAGVTWTNISDGFFTQTQGIGTVEVADSDPNVIYVGTGEANIRNYIPEGVGVYKSTDAGKTWVHKGLGGIGQVSRIVVHPKNPDLVYAAVLGFPFGPNPERGLYRSDDGGDTWRSILKVSDRAGAVDVSLDENRPEVLFAAFHQIVRPGPWLMENGGPDSGLYRSSDGGLTFEKITQGLPGGPLGRIGVDVSPADSNVVYVTLEATGDASGIYRSDDGGRSFTHVNRERELFTRHFFFGRIFADPRDPQTVYTGNIHFYRSVDGGRTFERVLELHVDHHDMWINPDAPSNWIQANDGGATITFTNGRSFSSLLNQATAEFYNVTTDTQFPYRVLGAQHDNSTISVTSRPVANLPGTRVSPGTMLGLFDAYSVAGGEQGEIRAHPRLPSLVYSGNYQGELFEYNHETRQDRNIEVYPQLGEGTAPDVLKYRFRVQAPLRTSPHDPNVVYLASQHVHRSTDRGTSFEVISPDLSRNDRTKQAASGGAISKDNVGTEIYGAIKSLEESPHVKGEIWVGTDDGRVHVTRDGGARWQDITPPSMLEWSTVNGLELSPHHAGRAFLSVIRNGLGDFRPYVFRTDDYGESWDFLTAGNGIPDRAFVRVVREDSRRRGLLYAGTEIGMYVSFDDGARWQPLQLNLPIVQVADMVFKDEDLVVATYGRCFWILDDITPLSQMQEAVQASAFLFEPRLAYRPTGAMLYFSFQEVPRGPVALEVAGKDGAVVRTFRGGSDFEPRAGLNRLLWDLRYPPADTVPDAIWFGANEGPLVAPGDYEVRLTVDGRSSNRTLRVAPHPMAEATQADYEEQVELALEVIGRLNRISDAIRWIRETRRILGTLPAGSPAVEEASAIVRDLHGLEGHLMQTKNRTPVDTSNFPTMLDGHYIKALNVITSADARPTEGVRNRLDDLRPEVDRRMAEVAAASTRTRRLDEERRAAGAGALELPVWRE